MALPFPSLPLPCLSPLSQTRLEVATTWSAWCEPLGYSETRKVRPAGGEGPRDTATGA